MIESPLASAQNAKTLDRPGRVGRWYRNGGVTGVTYSGIMELMADTEAPAECPIESSRKDSRGASWDLGAGWDGATRLARNGWPEGAAKMRAIAARVFDRLSPLGPVNTAPEYDVSGAALDAGAYCSGDPECYLTFGAEDRPTIRPVRLVVNLVASCYVNANALMLEGAAVVAAADVLAARGCPLEIWAVWATRLGFNSHHAAVLLAGDGVPFCADTLAYWLGHPAAMRRHFFAVLERAPMPLAARFCEEGYGNCDSAALADGGALAPRLGVSSEEAALNAAWRLLAANGVALVPQQ